MITLIYNDNKLRRLDQCYPSQWNGQIEVFLVRKTNENMRNPDYTNYTGHYSADKFQTQHAPLVYSIHGTVFQTTQPLIPQSPLHTQSVLRTEVPSGQQFHSSYVFTQPSAPLEEDIEAETIYPSAPLEEDREQYVLHNIDFSSDTITSLALRYGANEEDIKNINRMSDLDLFEGTTLIIPLTDAAIIRNMIDEEDLQNITLERKQRALVALFSKTFKISAQEARYYLSLHEWVFADAAEEYQEDIKWEKENKVKEMIEKNILVTSNLSRMQEINFLL
jgi:hypothetical protein